MTRKQIEHVVCDGCYREEPVAPGGFMRDAAAPDGWTKWEDLDICPSCRSAIRHFLFNRDRVTVITSNVGAGHPDERAAWITSLSPADRERLGR